MTEMRTDTIHEVDPAAAAVAVELLLEEVTAECPNGSVRGIGICGQMHGALLLDRQDHPLIPFIGWQDRRSEPSLGALKQSTGKIRARPGHTLSILHALKVTGQFPHGAERVTLLPEFIAAALTESSPESMHATNAASTGAMNETSDRWDERTLDRAGIPISLFPRIRTELEQAGILRPTLTRRLHVPHGTPVFLPIGDQQASLIGGGLGLGTMDSINIGTGAQVSRLLPSAFAPTELADCEFRPFPGGLWLATFPGLPGGRFLRENPGNASHQQMARIYHETYLRLPGTAQAAAPIQASGSVLRKTKALKDEFERAFGRPLALTRHEEEAPLGAAIAAAVGSGAMSSIREAQIRLLG
jgi:sugar (pentulose or hexulose) kinase